MSFFVSASTSATATGSGWDATVPAAGVATGVRRPPLPFCRRRLTVSLAVLPVTTSGFVSELTSPTASVAAFAAVCAAAAAKTRADVCRYTFTFAFAQHVTTSRSASACIVTSAAATRPAAVAVTAVDVRNVGPQYTRAPNGPTATMSLWVSPSTSAIVSCFGVTVPGPG